MIGKYHIEVSSKRNKYVLDVKRKYTFILGDSGTGKTKLGVLLRRGMKPGGNKIKISCNIPVKFIDSYDSLLLKYKNKSNKAIYIIDEDVADEIISLDNGKTFSRETEHMSAYFILMTRQKFGCVPYSPLEIYEFSKRMVGTCSVHTMQPVYILEDSFPVKTDTVIVEDLKLGYKFFENTLSCNVISSYGNGNIQNVLNSEIKNGNKTIYVIADGAAFGCSIRKLFDIKEKNKYVDIKFFCPESFEYLILRSGIFTANISDELSNTFNYAETSIYFSWERYYTELLEKVSKEKGGYSKNAEILPKYLRSSICVRKIYDVIKEIIQC